MLAPDRPGATEADADAAPIAPPPTLAAFRFVLQDELDADDRRAMVARLRHIPQPAPALQKLVSRKFMTRATTRELGEVVMSNPLLAAKVLSTVNSPFYGLRTPVLSIGQAITFLGFNTVRSVGLRYMLGESIQAGSPALTRTFDTIWNASALASELCLKLAQKLNLPDQGVLATHMVLSFVGQLASCSLMPAHVAGVTSRLGLLERTQGEQTQLGVGSTEIGSVLMQEWGLPASIINDVRDIDHVLVTPAPAIQDAQRGARLALCYLCARLGERLAQGTLSELAAFDLDHEQDLNLFHLRSYLQTPALARLPAYLHSAEVLAAVERMQESIPGHG